MLTDLFFTESGIRANGAFFFPLLLCFLLSCSHPVQAGEVAALLEGPQWPYEKALEGLRGTCSCSPHVFYLQEVKTAARFKKEIAALNPDLLVAVGSKSLDLLLTHDFNMPVVYSMVLNPWSIGDSSSKQVAGVSMNVAPQLYWDAMRNISPPIETVGLVYNPGQTQLLKDHAELLTRKAGQKLIAMEAGNPKEALRAIKDMAPRIDAFWMIPDQTLIRQEIIDTLVSYSLEQRFVLIGLSQKYVKAGALLAYTFNSEAIGKAVGRVVNAILNDTLPEMENRSIWAPDTELAVNLKTARKIGVVLKPSFLEKASFIIE